MKVGREVCNLRLGIGYSACRGSDGGVAVMSWDYAIAEIR